ncbi:hypothetical protein EMCG_06076 [[Emmonsia] crescens]|uniref:Uncharacterized protein n=1 Tax=[Emmonsia] crescens TaxID=73230 RepID=A0A0G2ICF7_9EURO|nr:hypothetical protein EMCG_06076 [Emmonsia crescens UAMH 3008]
MAVVWSTYLIQDPPTLDLEQIQRVDKMNSQIKSIIRERSCRVKLGEQLQQQRVLLEEDEDSTECRGDVERVTSGRLMWNLPDPAGFAEPPLSQPPRSSPNYIIGI